MRLNLRTLRKEWLPIFLLAVPGVLITAVMVAAVVSFALISATDPVAVIAFFRTLGVDKRRMNWTWRCSS